MATAEREEHVVDVRHIAADDDEVLLLCHGNLVHVPDDDVLERGHRRQEVVHVAQGDEIELVGLEVHEVVVAPLAVLEDHLPLGLATVDGRGDGCRLVSVVLFGLAHRLHHEVLV